LIKGVGEKRVEGAEEDSRVDGSPDLSGLSVGAEGEKKSDKKQGVGG